jgi:hypothetical protein
MLMRNFSRGTERVFENGTIPCSAETMTNPSDQTPTVTRLAGDPPVTFSGNNVRHDLSSHWLMLIGMTVDSCLNHP